jgi:enoyl-CoA hydratase/carnithine racemase
MSDYLLWVAATDVEETMADSDAILRQETHGYIRLLTMSRPERMNALSPELSDALIAAFVEAGADPEVRVIVLTAVGDRAFCAGADLKARAQRMRQASHSSRCCRGCSATCMRLSMKPSSRRSRH